MDRGTLSDFLRNTTLNLSYLCDSSAPDPQTGEPSAALQSCHVHGTLPLRVFHREETLHYLQVSSYLLFKNYVLHTLAFHRQVFGPPFNSAWILDRRSILTKIWNPINWHFFCTYLNQLINWLRLVQLCNSWLFFNCSLVFLSAVIFICTSGYGGNCIFWASCDPNSDPECPPLEESAAEAITSALWKKPRNW